ncbi:MAG: MFS transporter, partial [Pseudomonadales bacterium]|nr:MFS transporter [Pseudomonadales bacterium]
ASFYFLFAPPAGLTEMGLFWWLTIFSIATRTFMTFYSVPHMSLGAELTSDYDERTLLSSIRMVLQLLGMFAVLIGGPIIFFGATSDYDNGQLDPDAYPPFAMAGFFIMVIGVWVSALGTHSQIKTYRNRARKIAFHPDQCSVTSLRHLVFPRLRLSLPPRSSPA